MSDKPRRASSRRFPLAVRTKSLHYLALSGSGSGAGAGKRRAWPPPYTDHQLSTPTSAWSRAVKARRCQPSADHSCGGLGEPARPTASNSSWVIRWAFALADCRTSAPPSCGVALSLACVRKSELWSHDPKPKRSRLAVNVQPPHPSVVEKLCDWGARFPNRAAAAQFPISRLSSASLLDR
jgi:hypothetical protein